ncbi:MAG: trigger factor [Dysgonamonadaceae bacterium]|jgi:trigger factor|nr:trigger factor [Dysgonamonadaceae bacterium]
MNVTLNKIDAVNAAITIGLAKSDYEGKVENRLKKIRKTVNLPGFRKGNAPASAVKRMYGASVMIEEINDMVSEALNDYIRDEKIKILGDPMLNRDATTGIDVDNPQDLTFVFDIALAPEINVNLDKSDELTIYKVQISDEMIDRQISSFKANFGTEIKVEEAEERDLIRGEITELGEAGQPKEDGIKFDGAILMASYMKNDGEKAKFIHAKVGSDITFNPYKAYEGHQAELSSFLKIKKEEVDGHKGDFLFHISEISHYQEAEINQELFNKVFGAGNVASEKEFRAKTAEIITRELQPQIDYRFILDARDYIQQKANIGEFPDDFLKRWLVSHDEKRTKEEIEADYPKIREDLKFQLIWEFLAAKFGVKVDDNDIIEESKKAAREQFARYGMANVPEQLIDNYSAEMLKKDETIRNLVDKAVEGKMIAAIKGRVSLKEKTVSVEELADTFKPETEKTEKDDNKK